MVLYTLRNPLFDALYLVLHSTRWRVTRDAILPLHPPRLPPLVLGKKEKKGVCCGIGSEVNRQNQHNKSNIERALLSALSLSSDPFFSIAFPLFVYVVRLP